MLLILFNRGGGGTTGPGPVVTFRLDFRVTRGYACDFQVVRVDGCDFPVSPAYLLDFPVVHADSCDFPVTPAYHENFVL